MDNMDVLFLGKVWIYQTVKANNDQAILEEAQNTSKYRKNVGKFFVSDGTLEKVVGSIDLLLRIKNETENCSNDIYQTTVSEEYKNLPEHSLTIEAVRTAQNTLNTNVDGVLKVYAEAYAMSVTPIIGINFKRLREIADGQRGSGIKYELASNYIREIIGRNSKQNNLNPWETGVTLTNASFLINLNR
ncbi:MAG: hypothetical protein ACP5N3_00680 [Candidatus Nanoarchaeia archaeon]